MFFARVRLRRILDLGNEQVIQVLGLTEDDLFGPWRLSRRLTRLQELGLAISQQQSITALRFPSAALRSPDQPGWNLALFPLSLRSPDRIEILGNSDVPIERLP
jgi:hypothetical protein